MNHYTQIEQHRRNGQISRNIQTAKTESRRKTQFENIVH